MKKRCKRINFLLILCLGLFAVVIQAQNTTFTYQGILTDNLWSASGTYQMRFTLHDLPVAGTQIGSAIEIGAVTVTNGVFSVELDFVNAPPVPATFTATNRYLQISVRRNSNEPFVVLSPRQRLTATPFAIHSVTATNALNLGGVPPSRFIQADGNSRVTLTGNTALNNNFLHLRDLNDFNHGITYNSTADGMEFRGFAGFRWMTGASGSTTRMVMNPDGRIGIGNVTPQDRLHVGGDIRVGTQASGGCIKDSFGTAIAGTSCSSDARFKQQISSFPSTLDKLVRLRPVNYFWNTKQFPEKGFGEKQSYGLIAQEVEEIMPELVTQDEQGYKAVNYSKLPLLTLQAVKELKAENDSYKEKLQQQQKQLDAQKLMIESLRKLVCHENRQAEICKEKRDEK